MPPRGPHPVPCHALLVLPTLQVGNSVTGRVCAGQSVCKCVHRGRQHPPQCNMHTSYSYRVCSSTANSPYHHKCSVGGEGGHAVTASMESNGEPMSLHEHAITRQHKVYCNVNSYSAIPHMLRGRQGDAANAKQLQFWGKPCGSSNERCMCYSCIASCGSLTVASTVLNKLT